MDPNAHFRRPEKVFREFRIARMTEENIGPIEILEDHVIGVSAGKIDWVVPESELPKFDPQVEAVSGQGMLLTPGLIDCHTHLVYGGNRADEWARRLGGETYSSIAAGGGGILSTVKATRAADDEELFRLANNRLSAPDAGRRYDDRNQIRIWVGPGERAEDAARGSDGWGRKTRSTWKRPCWPLMQCHQSTKTVATITSISFVVRSFPPHSNYVQPSMYFARRLRLASTNRVASWKRLPILA